MIYSVRGRLLLIDMNSAVIECGGVGYKCSVSVNTAGALPPVGSEALLYTHMVVRDDNVELFGFATLVELDCFRLLTSVSGVGPRVGLSLLSALTPDKIALAVEYGDAKALTVASGVGSKLAQRIALELKGKLGIDTALSSETDAPGAPAQESPSALGEAVSALESLGYSRSQAAVLLSGVDRKLSSGEMIKLALKKADKKDR